MNSKKISERLLKLGGDTPRTIIAKEVGVSTSALAMYETGKRIPRDDIKVALAKKYKTSVEKIFFTP